MLFEKFFGDSFGKIILSALIAFSVGGNIVTVLYHISRINQEIFREGFLPFSKMGATNYPFKTPIGSLLVPFVITTSFLLIPTSSSIFNYTINMESYPTQIFFGLACFGIIILRKRSPDIIPSIKASYFDIGFMIIFSVAMFLGPLIKPDQSQFPGLPNYAYTSIVILLLCMLYWLLMFKLVPRLLNYRLEKHEETLYDGLTITKWEKIKDVSSTYEPISDV